MGLSVRLCHNSSPVEKIGKVIDSGETFTCVLKDNTSILNPSIIILSNSASIPTYNYMYISDLGRYYFIDDVVSLNNNRWEIRGHVDVLETYKSGILAQSAVIKRQQSKYNLYLNDPDFMTYNNDTIQIKKFSTSAFSKTLKYALVVNGS